MYTRMCYIDKKNVPVVLYYQVAIHVKVNAKQKHPGCKKVRGQSEAALQIGMYDQKR